MKLLSVAWNRSQGWLVGRCESWSVGELRSWVSNGEGRHWRVPEVPFCSSLPRGGRRIFGISHYFLRRMVGVRCRRVGAKVTKDILCSLLLLHSSQSHRESTQMSPLKRSCGARFPVTTGEEARGLGLATACTGPATWRQHQINSSCLACR